MGGGTDKQKGRVMFIDDAPFFKTVFVKANGSLGAEGVFDCVTCCMFHLLLHAICNMQQISVKPHEFLKPQTIKTFAFISQQKRSVIS